MRNSSFLTAIVLSIGCLVSSAHADVILDFDTPGDTEGFVNNNGTSVAQDSFNGGSLMVTALGGGDIFSPLSQSTTLTVPSGSPLEAELIAASLNGGTISFESFAQGDDFNFNGSPPGLLEIVLNVGSGFSSDTEVLLQGVPAAGASSNATFSATVAGASGQQFNGTDGSINVASTGPFSLSLGFNNGSGSIADGVFFIDNLTVSANTAAIPEPSSLVGHGAIAGLALVRRKRRIA